jgi:hypothetical protein
VGLPTLYPYKENDIKKLFFKYFLFSIYAVVTNYWGTVRFSIQSSLFCDEKFKNQFVTLLAGAHIDIWLKREDLGTSLFAVSWQDANQGHCSRL